jgi:hypothetical protein
VQIECYRDDATTSVYDDPKDAWVIGYEMCDGDPVEGALTAREKTALKLSSDSELYGGPASALGDLYATCATTASSAFGGLRPSMSEAIADYYLSTFVLCPDHPLHARFFAR